MKSFAARRTWGFSLIESMATLAVVAILLTAASPSFGRWIDQQRLQGAAQQLLADLQLIRTEAVARQQGLRLSVSNGPAGDCHVLHTGDKDSCDCGTSAPKQFVDSEAALPAQCSNGAVELKTVRWPSANQITLKASSSSMLFDAVDGTSTPTGTLEISNAHGQRLRHIVNVMGRVRTCTPDSSMPGHPPC